LVVGIATGFTADIEHHHRTNEAFGRDLVHGPASARQVCGRIHMGGEVLGQAQLAGEVAFPVVRRYLFGCELRPVGDFVGRRLGADGMSEVNDGGELLGFVGSRTPLREQQQRQRERVADCKRLPAHADYTNTARVLRRVAGSMTRSAPAPEWDAAILANVSWDSKSHGWLRSTDWQADRPTCQAGYFPRYPGPRSGCPPNSPVNLPRSSVSTPLTSTYSIPTEGWCGSSKVARSFTVSGLKMVMSA